MHFNKENQTRDSVYARIYVTKSVFLEQGIHFWWLCFEWIINVLLLLICTECSVLTSPLSTVTLRAAKGTAAKALGMPSLHLRSCLVPWNVFSPLTRAEPGRGWQSHYISLELLFGSFAAFTELGNINAQKIRTMNSTVLTAVDAR